MSMLCHIWIDHVPFQIGCIQGGMAVDPCSFSKPGYVEHLLHRCVKNTGKTEYRNLTLRSLQSNWKIGQKLLKS